MKSLAPIDENLDLITKEYVDETTAKPKNMVGRMIPVEYAGHRGAAKIYPESSMQGFLALSEAGYIPEMDLRVLSTGEFVCSHDATIDRAFNGTGTVSSMTNVEWSKLTIKDNPFTILVRPEKAVFFEDVLDKVASNSAILPEIKFSDSGDVDRYIALIKSKNLGGNVITQAADWDIAKQLAAGGLTSFYLPNADYGSWLHTPSDIAAEGVEYVLMPPTATSTNVGAVISAGLVPVCYLPNTATKTDSDAQIAKGNKIIMHGNPWEVSGVSDAVQDTGWIDIAYAADMTYQTEESKLQYRKIMNVYYFRGTVKRTSGSFTGTSNYVVGTGLPAELSDAWNTIGIGSSGTGGNTTRFYISGDSPTLLRMSSINGVETSYGNFCIRPIPI